MGSDNKLYTAPAFGGSWKWTGPLAGSCCVKDVIQLQDGTFVGVGSADNSLYGTSSIKEPVVWAGIQNPGCSKCIVQLLDGTFACIGCDNQIYVKPTLTGVWQATTPGGSADGTMKGYQFVYLTQFPDGTFAGVGPNNLLYTTPTINPTAWTQVGNTVNVKCVSWYK